MLPPVRGQSVRGVVERLPGTPAPVFCWGLVRRLYRRVLAGPGKGGITHRDLTIGSRWCFCCR